MADMFASIDARFPDEEEFKKWYAGHAAKLGLAPDPDDPQHFYDYRAAFAAGAAPDETGHWPSKFKTEGHPRMVLDGVNTKTGEPVADDLDAGALENYATVAPTAAPTGASLDDMFAKIDARFPEDKRPQLIPSRGPDGSMTPEQSLEYYSAAANRPEYHPNFSMGRLMTQQARGIAQGAGSVASAQAAHKGGQIESVERIAAAPAPSDTQRQIMSRYFARLTESDKADWGEKAAQLDAAGATEPEKQQAMYSFIKDKLSASKKGFEEFAEGMPEFLPGTPAGVGGFVEESAKAIAPTAVPMVMNFIPGASPVATALTFETIYGGAYEKYIKQKKDPAVARDAALLTAVPSTILEQGGNAFQAGVMKGLIKPSYGGTLSDKIVKFMTTIPEMVLSEAMLEEVPQTFVEAAADVYADNPDGSAEEWVAEYKKRLPETTESARQAAKVAGGGALLMLGGASAAKGAVTGYQKLADRHDAKVLAAAETVGDLDAAFAKIDARFPENAAVQEKRTAPETGQTGGQIPEFKTTNEAVDFGEKASESQIAELKRLEDEARIKEAEYKAAKDFSEDRTNNAYRAQLYREAQEAARGEHPSQRDRRTPEQMTADGEQKGSSADDRSGGYYSTGSKMGAQGNYAPRQRSQYGFLLPDILEIAKELNDGKTPEVVEEMHQRGRFKYNPDSADIAVRADIAIGDRIAGIAARPKDPPFAIRKNMTKEQIAAARKASVEDQFKKFQDDVTQQSGLTPGELAFRKKFHKATGETHFFAYHKNPALAGKVAAHDAIGHLDTWYPHHTLKVGGIGSHISTIKKHIGAYLNSPTGSSFDKKNITQELKDLSQAWKPFDEQFDPEYTKYRYSAAELYADAVSAMFTDPMLLREKAPTFAKAMDEFASERPEFSQALTDVVNRYAQGPEAVGDRILENQYAGMERGDRTLAAAQKASIKETESFKDTVASWTWDKYQQILKHVRQAEKSSDPQVVKEARKVRRDLEEVAHIASEVKGYVEDVSRDVVEPLTKAGLTIKHLGAYLMNNHIIENRKEMLNPLGVSSEEGTAQAALDSLLREIGRKKYERVAELAKRYRQIREERIIPRIEKSSIASPEMMKTIKGRDAYAKVQVVDHIEKTYGGGVAGRFHHQIGTLKEQANPFIFTLLQDISLLRTAKLNEAKTSTVDFLMDVGLVEVAEEKHDGKVIAPVEPPKGSGKKLITVMRDGKPSSYVVSETVADLFEFNPVEATMVSTVLNNMNTFFRAVLVSKNPVWMIRNVMRDVRTTIKNLPEARVKNLPALARAYKEAYGDVWRYVWNGDRSQDIKDMQKGYMLIPGRVYGTKELNSDDEIVRLRKEWGIDFDSDVNNQADGAWKRVKHVMNQKARQWKLSPDRWGMLSEMGGKVAGYKFLKEMGTRSDEEIGHVVRTRVGTPDYKRQGTRIAHALTNNFFLFSNVNKEGLRSAWESFKEDKSAYLVKTIMYNVLPKLAWMLAAREFPEVKKATDNLTRYMKTHYSIPFMWLLPDDNTWALMIPEDYEGQLWGSILYNLLEGPISGEGGPRIASKGGVVDTLTAVNPYRSHPLWNVARNWYLWGVHNVPVIDDFRGQPVLSQSLHEEGGWPATKEMLKYAWNNLGGATIYRIPTGELEKETPDGPKKITRIPGVSNLFNSIFVITNSGRAERYREEGDAFDKIERTRSNTAKREIQRFINERGYDVDDDTKSNLYLDMEERGMLPEDFSHKKFRLWYSAIQNAGRDEPRITALVFANSNKKKGMYLNRFSKEMKPAEFSDFIDKMWDNEVISGDAVFEMQKLQQKKE